MIPSNYFRKDIRYFISVTCIRLGNHESKTFFYHFGLHLMLGGKLDVGRREGLKEMRLTVTFKI